MALLREDEQMMSSIHFVGNASKLFLKKNDWILDSGSSDHIISNDALLKNKQKVLKGTKVTLPNG